MDLHTHIAVSPGQLQLVLLLCIHAAILATSFAQNEATNSIPNLDDDDDLALTENDIPDSGYWKLKDLLSSEQNKRFSDDVDKRFNPNSFSFSRGKKDLSFPEMEGDLIEAPMRRLSASEFFGARGRRTPPQGFLGSRGKRFQEYLDELEAENERMKRQPPRGFVVARGKKLSPSGFLGMRGKKNSPPAGFYGPRGKKPALSPFGFQGARGKRLNELLMHKKSPPAGFLGSRGRRSDIETLEDNDNSQIDKMGNALINRWRSFGKPTSNFEELFEKRQPSLGFYPLRG